MRLILKTHTSASQLNSMTNPTFADISRTSGSSLVFLLLNNYGLFVTFSVLIRRYVDEQQSKFALAKKNCSNQRVVWKKSFTVNSLY